MAYTKVVEDNLVFYIESCFLENVKIDNPWRTSKVKGRPLHRYADVIVDSKENKLVKMNHSLVEVLDSLYCRG